MCNLTQVVCVFERCWPSAGPGAAAAVCAVRCCCPAPSGELFASSVSVPSHCAARSPTPACAPKTQKRDSQVIKLQTTAWTRSTQCLKSLRTNILGESHLQLCPFMNLFSTYYLIPHSTPPAPPTIVFLHLSVSRSVSCFCRASTFPCSSAFMSSSDWSFCLRSCSDLCSLWVTKYKEERQFKGM